MSWNAALNFIACLSLASVLALVVLIFAMLARHGGNRSANVQAEAQRHTHRWKETSWELQNFSGGKYEHDPKRPNQQGVFVSHDECTECGEKRDRTDIGFV